MSNYELKQVTILEIEVETQRQQIKVLREKIAEKEKIIKLQEESAEKHRKLVDGLLADLTQMLGNPH
jgi:hypothetical protein